MRKMVGYIYIHKEFEELFVVLSQPELHFLMNPLPFIDEDGLIYTPKDNEMEEIQLGNTKSIIDYWGVSTPTGTKYLSNLLHVKIEKIVMFSQKNTLI
ncbi:hypothetical protein ACIQF3_26675 [Bacillus thuringiensis]|uniref:hypothetical protein n=1 Tax=Bacillus thuringiensis TaxID=1428 RepID=UPI002FFE7D1D